MPPAATVDAYLSSLPPDRAAALRAVRDVVNANLPAGYEEGLHYGMIGWCVPHARYPAGYHTNPKQPLPFASLGSQKSHMALYLFCVYARPAVAEWFAAEYAKTGKKLDMGKSCVRFKKIDDLPLDLIGRTIARLPVDEFIAGYEAALGPRAAAKKAPAAAKKPAAKKAPAAAKKTPAATKAKR